MCNRLRTQVGPSLHVTIYKYYAFVGAGFYENSARYLLHAPPMSDSPPFEHAGTDGMRSSEKATEKATEKAIDVSVILPFGDDEEAVGVAVRRAADYLRAAGWRFEIFAIDEDSGDNSHAVLALLRADVPELRVTHASGRGRGVEVGVARAQGTVLIVTTPDVAAASLDGLADACQRLFAGRSDAEIALGRYTVAHRVRSLVAFRGGRLVGSSMHRQLAKRMQDRNLTTEVAPTSGVTSRTTVSRLRAFAARAARPL